MEQNDLDKEIRGQTVGYISAALGLVAGLAWNEAIGSMIEAVFPMLKDTVLVKFVYAILVTVAVVVLVRYLNKFFKKP